MCVRVCVYGMYTAHFLAPPVSLCVCVTCQRGRGCVGDKEKLSLTLVFHVRRGEGVVGR